MEKTKKGTPSGVDCRMYAAMLTKFKRCFAFLSVLFCMLMLTSNAWACSAGTGTHYASATTDNPAQGLVYMSNSNEANVSDAKFKNYYPGGSLTCTDKTETTEGNACYQSGNSTGCTPTNRYFWARPSRGWEFDGSWGTRGTNYAATPSSKGVCLYGDPDVCDDQEPINLDVTFTGAADIIQTTAGGKQATWVRPVAHFKEATKYTITYIKPVGGTYNVHYSYTESYNTGETEAGGNAVWKFRNTTEDYNMTSSLEGNESVNSYVADTIILTVPNEATNFIGWFENDSEEPIETKKSFRYIAHDNVSIRAMFKEIGWGDVSGDLAVNVTAKGTYDQKLIYLECPTLIGNWTNGDFTISPKVPGEANDASNEYGSIEFGSVLLNTSVSPSRLEIPYTYTATNWGGISVDVTVTPAYGEAKQFTIAAYSEEVVDYEACIEENGERTYTGTLAEMMTQANTMDNKPTLKLMNNKTITAPLSFTNSFIFDVNGNVLTANCASAFSIDAASIDVQIIDGSFTQVGEIHTSNASSGVVSVVTFTQKAKLTMQGGTLSAENTGSGSAYGVSVSNGSIFYMTNGQLTVAGVSEARGVNVASANDYATFNGGSLTVSAPTNAYGLWSAGQSNITNATISVETTTGTNAYGAYIDGSTSTLTNNTITANAKTTNAYGAYVNAGRLNTNGGSFAATAITSDVYGVYVASGATLMMQQKAVVTAEATGASGTNVFGINNLGTASLTNISVTATSPTTNATAVNTATGEAATTIDGGTYRANTGGNTAYSLHHQGGTLDIDGGTFRAIGSGNEIYGALAAENATIANAIFRGETQGTGYSAYGFKGDGTNKNISLNGCTIEAISNTSKAYAIYSNANVDAIGSTMTATAKETNEAYGLYANAGINTLTNCNANVSAKTIQAYGIYQGTNAASLTVAGGQYNVVAEKTDGNSELYGIYQSASGLTATVSDARFIATGSSQNVYGAYIQGSLNSTSSAYNAQAKLNVYGIWGGAESTLTLANNTITSQATNGTVSYGIYAKKNFTIDGDIVSAIGSTNNVYAMFFDASTSNGEVLGGKFSTTANAATGFGALNDAGTVNNVQLKGGIYKTTINLQKYIASGYQIFHLDETHPDYADGYRYTIAMKNPSPYVCHIVGGAYYATLEAAMQYALDNSGSNWTIVMTQPYTLPAGDYILPSNATLVVPYKFGQTSITNDSNPANPDIRTTTGMRDNFMCLTFADGVHLNVDGKIGVSSEMFCTENGKTSYINGPYGRIHMEAGSLVQLNSGAYLYAWGLITGAGNIMVKNNAEVREMFQVDDMKSAANLYHGYRDNPQKFFPITKYSIQNIEVPTTYYYNSRLYAAMLCAFSMSGSYYYYGEKNIKIVGTNGALFQVTTDDESSWVRKSYTNSYQLWNINSSAQLGSISIKIENVPFEGTITFNSADYILPITHNMKMHVLDGDFEITHDSELLPGASVEVDKTASLTIAEGQNVYIFDKDQWMTSTSYADAAINVHGSIFVKGALYTTQSIEGGKNLSNGANIYSTNVDAGTVVFENAAPNSITFIDLITSIANEEPVTKTVTMDPALLKNGTGASEPFTETSGIEKEHAFAYMDNTWTETSKDECFEYIGNHAYAKPSDYVEIKKQRDEEGTYDDKYITDDHIYLSIDESRIFIHLPDAEGNCQWWEVVATTDPTVYKCEKPGYEGFYYYDIQAEGWALKTVNVDFYSTEEGEDILKTIVTDFNGIPDQAVIATNPTKGTTDEYTYQFYGWKSSVTDTEYPWTATLEVATADMSYRPVFTKTKRNYTVTFINANNGADVPVEVAYGARPNCDSVKDPTAQYTYYFLYWLDSNGITQYAPGTPLPPVNGPTSYTAVWAQIVNKYTVIWKNGEEVLETDTKQEYGASVSYDGAAPTRAMDPNYKYVFDGWSLTDGGAKLTSLPTVNGEMTFYAHYSTTPRYAITFANYDGGQLQKEQVTAGEHPTYNGLTPARVRDLDGYYVFIGWQNSDGDPFSPNETLPAVTGKETYTAQYSYTNDLFEITLHNVDGNGASWSGWFGEGSTPFYNPNKNDIPVIPEKEGNAQYNYPFIGWDPALETVSATSTKEFTAQFGQETNSYTITFANVDGNGAEEPVVVEYGQTPASPVTPTKADECKTFAFDHWSPAIQSVTGSATYTAVFSETHTTRTFAITFDGDNDVVVVMDVECGTKPAPATPTKEDAAFYYTFTGWSDGEHVYATADLPVASAEATYTAQYSQTLRSYTITFVNYDGTPLQSSTMAYGMTPAYNGTTPERPLDIDLCKKYTFNGWSPAITTVSGYKTYTAQYNESDFVAAVIPTSGDTYYASSWTDAMSHVSNNCTVKLYSNIGSAQGIGNNNQISTNMTIDLNGHTITYSHTSGNQNVRLFNVNNAALTIDDSHGDGGINYSVSVNVNNHMFYVSRGSITINGGNLNSTYTGSNNTAYIIGPDRAYVSNSYRYPSVYINGGELRVTSNYNATVIQKYNNNSGTVNVTGGKLYARGSNDVSGSRSTIFSNAPSSISGGYYSKDANISNIASGYEKRDVGNEEPEHADYVKKVVQVYIITFKNWNNNNLETPKTWEVGTTPAYTGATPTKDPQSLYNFIGWKNTDDDFFAVDAALPAVAGAETYTAQFDEVETFDVNGDASVEENATVETTTIHTGGTLDVKNGVTLTTTNLILEASESASGQITETGTITADHVFFDWTMNGVAGTQKRTWYAIATPWAVDAETGISIKDGRTLVLGRDFDLIYYSGEERALVGNKASCWKYVEYDGDKTMVPGRLYMMYFGQEGIQTLRFTKQDGAAIRNTADMKVYEYDEQTGNDGKDANWNGIANPRSYYASLQAGNTYAQVLNNGNLEDYFSGESSPVYQTINLAASTFRVGKPLFVQSTGEQSVVVDKVTTANIVNAAPRRRAAAQNAQEGIDVVYEVTISAEDKPVSDNLFIQATEEEKADKYVIGKDLAKGGVAAKRAQMWVERYDTKLSVNTQTSVNEETTYPLGLFAPAAGEYTINTNNTYSDYTLYLTWNGEAIWNLSNSAYTISLPQGNTAEYGLRICAKKAPQVATGMDEAVVDAQGETRKVIIEDKVFIIRNNQVYSIDGQLVK